MNSKYPWIKDSGSCTEAELPKKIGIRQFDYFIAFCTDKFIAARADRISGVLENTSGILELRLFADTAELRFFRSMYGENFTWRLADDTGLDLIYMMESRQKLDIDTKHPPHGEAAYGGKLLRSTGGGVYELPIDNETSVVLVRYLDYDKDGAVYEADFRVKCFAGTEA